jgi:hypothetical protein
MSCPFKRSTKGKYQQTIVKLFFITIVINETSLEKELECKGNKNEEEDKGQYCHKLHSPFLPKNQ